MTRQLLLAAAALVLPLSAANFQLVTNGGFESGLTGWTSTQSVNASIGGCATLWNVSTSGGATGCNPVNNPISGAQAAYTSFDGYGAGVASYGPGYTQAQNYTLAQSIFIPTGVSAATLSFMETTYMGGPSPSYAQYFGTVLPRSFHIDLATSQGALLANLFTQTINVTNGDPPINWNTMSTDVTSILQGFQGQTLQLQITATVPQYFTGPGGLGIDNVALSGTTTPEPGSAWLLVAGAGAVVVLRKSGKRAAA